MFKTLIVILLSAVLVNNYVLRQFLGICPFLGVSKKLNQAVGMGIATGKAVEGLSRQPEVEGKIRTNFMLGIVFMETAIIYALLVIILIIFVI